MTIDVRQYDLPFVSNVGALPPFSTPPPFELSKTLTLLPVQVAACARVVAVADVYDALTSVRPYKKAWASEQAFQYVASEAGRHFDPRIAQAFGAMKKDVLQIQNEWRDPPGASAKA